MTTRISTALQEIQRRVDAATPGPWSLRKNPMRDDGYFAYESSGKTLTFAQTTKANAELIANAPTDLTKLVKALEVAVDFIEDYCVNEVCDCNDCCICDAVTTKDKIEKILGDK